MNEEWKSIKGYENLYEISNLGKVKNINTKKILRSYKRKDGYLKIELTKEKSNKTFYIHRLVAQTFILNPNNLFFVNHKDEDKTNNCVDNLEWCTQKYNNKYGTRGKRIANSLNIKVNQYDLNGKFIKQWESIKEATETLKIRNISQACRNIRNQAGGFIWKYENK